MDPQACLQRILDAYGTNDVDEFNHAFGDLAEWLIKDGYAPKLSSLDVTCPVWNANKRGHFNYGRKQTRIATKGSGKVYAIQVIDHLNDSGDGPYEFVIYYPTEKATSFKLPMG